MSLLRDEKKIFFEINNMYMSPKRKLWLFRKSGVNATESKLFY